MADSRLRSPPWAGRRLGQGRPLLDISILRTLFARLLIVVLVVLSPFALSGARAQLLNGGFETYTTGAGAAIANWTTTAEYVNGTNPKGIETSVVIAGAATLDLWNNDNAKQTFSMAGPLATTYSLSVKVLAYTNIAANVGTQTFTISLGNQSQTFITGPSSQSLANVQTFTLTNIVLAATGNVLTITDASLDHNTLGYVLLVDSVTLTPTPAPIPGAGLPSYLLVALAVLLVNRRRILALAAQAWRRIDDAHPPDGG